MDKQIITLAGEVELNTVHLASDILRDVAYEWENRVAAGKDPGTLAEMLDWVIERVQSEGTINVRTLNGMIAAYLLAIETMAHYKALWTMQAYQDDPRSALVP